MVTVSEWENDKEHISYFETEQSKKLTYLFFKYGFIKMQLKEMGF